MTLSRYEFVYEREAKNATTRSSSDAMVTLGSSHSIAVELLETLKSVKSRMYTYSPSCQFIAYGP